MKIFIILLTFLCLFTFSETIVGQNKTDKLFIAPSTDSGENASSIIDLMLAESKNNNERIFIIFRIGENEKEEINLIRLRSTKQHFLNKQQDSQNLVFARGESIKGEGRIEFYIGSELRLVLLAKRNRMPNLTCCPV